MVRRLVIMSAVVMAASAAQATAQEAPPANVAGNWDFAFETPQGATMWRATFEQVADSLRGSVQSDFGTLPLSGLVAGTDIKFGVTIIFDGQAIDLWFSGKVADKTAQGTIDVPAAGMQIPWTAKRVEEAGALEGPARPGAF